MKKVKLDAAHARGNGFERYSVQVNESALTPVQIQVLQNDEWLSQLIDWRKYISLDDQWKRASDDFLKGKNVFKVR